MSTDILSDKDAYPLILIVDDDPTMGLALQEIFEFSGYTVLTATNAYEALDMMRAADTPPALIISDILMEGMDGYQFFQAVREEERWRDIPFIFLSAKSKLRDDVERHGLSGQGYLTKPFIVDDLLMAVNRAVAH